MILLSQEGAEDRSRLLETLHGIEARQQADIEKTDRLILDVRDPADAFRRRLVTDRVTPTCRYPISYGRAVRDRSDAVLEVRREGGWRTMTGTPDSLDLRGLGLRPGDRLSIRIKEGGVECVLIRLIIVSSGEIEMELKREVERLRRRLLGWRDDLLEVRGRTWWCRRLLIRGNLTPDWRRAVQEVMRDQTAVAQAIRAGHDHLLKLRNRARINRVEDSVAELIDTAVDGLVRLTSGSPKAITHLAAESLRAAAGAKKRRDGAWHLIEVADLQRRLIQGIEDIWKQLLQSPEYADLLLFSTATHLKQREVVAALRHEMRLDDHR